MAKWSLSDMMQIGSHIHLITDLVGAFTGKEPTEKTPEGIKGFYGIFGKKDELTVTTLLRKMDGEDRELLSDFFGWLFEYEGALQWTESVFARNDFFTFIAKKHSIETTESNGNQETTWGAKNTKGTTWQRKTTKNLYPSSSKSEALCALEDIAAFLKKYEAEIKAKKPKYKLQTIRKRAFRLTQERLSKVGYPCKKVGDTDWVAWASERFDWTLEQAEAFKEYAIPYLEKVYKLATTTTKEMNRRLNVESQRIETSKQPLTLKNFFKRLMPI